MSLFILSAACFALYATLADSLTTVLVAIIGALASIANTWILSRERRERKQHYREQTAAIRKGGLVAMVPERIIEETEHGTGE